MVWIGELFQPIIRVNGSSLKPNPSKEQPVGTGFSQGTPSAVTEQDVAAQLMGFWRNFINTFSISNRKVYIAGESYAGMYIPWLADAMLNANDTRYFDVEAIMMYDPLINNNAVMREIPAIPFLNTWSELLALNDTFERNIRIQAAKCGYSNFLDEHLHYPPKGSIPSPPGGDAYSVDPERACDIWDAIIDAATLLNPVSRIFAP